ncbi:MAG: phosphatidate cytidylyltransferase [Saprospiraceae bacterium]|nr:phosphatidate cytidylyltransferase [Saprospiraceae bacterium]MBP6569523.1 phosphatidate cytidylyltransferase [Saprospiraceae bacterium]
MDKNQILKQRSATGFVFGIAVLILLMSGKTGTIALACFIGGFSCYEYVRMIFHKNKKKLALSLSIIYFTIVILTTVLPTSIFFLPLVAISCVALISGIINMFYTWIDHKKYFWLVALFYFGLPIGLFISFVLNSENYFAQFWIGVISMIWMSDSFAYLIGSRIGKRKLFEKISPKKSWEGFLGAGFFTLIAAYFIGIYFFPDNTDMYDIDLIAPFNSGFFWMLVAAIAWIVGTLGDLVESSVKRNFNVKDSGKLLPGHGGVLDRFDSFIYILPFILFLLLIFSNT